MEFNGKWVKYDGMLVSVDIGLVVWGELGINGQYVFYQFLYQGILVILCEFLIVVKGYEEDFGYYYDFFVVNCLV